MILVTKNTFREWWSEEAGLRMCPPARGVLLSGFSDEFYFVCSK